MENKIVKTINEMDVFNAATINVAKALRRNDMGKLK